MTWLVKSSLFCKLVNCMNQASHLSRSLLSLRPIFGWCDENRYHVVKRMDITVSRTKLSAQAFRRRLTPVDFKGLRESPF
jgi:hypothetical protein